jgi:uncharacterized protein YjiS (DUF1127 family)
MAASFRRAETARYYSRSQFRRSGYPAVTHDAQVPSIDHGKEIRMSTKPLRNPEAQFVRDEALESLLHMTSWAREAAALDETRLSSRSPRLAVLVDGIAVGAAALYPASWSEVDLDCSVAADASPARDEQGASASRGLLAGIARPVGGVLARAWRHLQHRREVHRAAAILSKLDDRALRDIGISRVEIGYVSLHGRDLDRWR